MSKSISDFHALADGYRWLKAGETLEPGDEFLHDRLCRWESTISSGHRVLCGDVYRRKLPLPPTPTPTPTVTDGYRWVTPDEILESTDEHLYAGKWTSTLASGHHAMCPHIYRRKLQPPTPKPPLGLMPRSIWIDNRKSEVIDAIHRYLDAGKDVPAAWLEELIDTK